MSSLRHLAVAAALSAAVAIPGVASAALLGTDVNASWRFSDINTVYDDYGDTTVGAGNEYSGINVDGVIFFDVDIADTSITVNYLDSFSRINPASFKGLFITDLDSVFPALTVFSVVVNGFTFLASDVIFQANGFGLDFQGDAFSGGESVTVNFADPAPIPLPAGGLLLFGGLGALAAMRRRKS